MMDRNKLSFSDRLVVSLLLCLSTGLLTAAEPKARPAAQVEGDEIQWIKKVADWQLSQASWDSSRNWEYGALYTGIMAAWEATRDEAYLNKARQWAEKYNWRMAGDSRFADDHACAQAYLEMYLLDEPDPRRYAHFASMADVMVSDPRHFNCDVSSGSDVWWWCDALFMAPPAFARLARITGDSGYLDLMHMMWIETQDCLYSPEERLFYRDIKYFDDVIGGEPVFWARGNGWVVAGLPRVLQYLPQEDPMRPRYVTLLREMASRLAEIQQPDGFWYANLLYPEQFDVPESSGTGFFCYGIAWGINNGILDRATYEPVVQAAWAALKSAVHEDGKLGWVQPVGAGPNGSYYDGCYVYGVGAYLLAGSEMQKLTLSQRPSTVDMFDSYVSTDALRQAWQDGAVNGTGSATALGDYGDRVLELAYDNTTEPHASRIDRVFDVPCDLTVENAVCLSLLVKGHADNSPAQLYVELEDQAGQAVVMTLADTSVITSNLWHEAIFPLTDLEGIDLRQIKRLSLGVSSDASVGRLRIDRLRLYPVRCFTKIPADLSGDCRVNLVDFAEFASQWMDQYAEILIPTNPGTANLLAYWPLDGDYGDDAGDHDAQPAGSPSFVEGRTGQGVFFDGGSYLNAQNSTGMHLSQGATISAWIKTDGVEDIWASIVTKGFQAWRLIRNNNNSTISFHFNSPSGEYQANGATPVFDGQWHHLMATYDGAAVRLYVDGQLDASAPAGTVNTTSDPVYIASRFNSTSTRNWNGLIDEVRIYDTALTETDLLYLLGSPPILRINDPRPADFILDGIINAADLEVFLQSWLTDGL